MTAIQLISLSAALAVVAAAYAIWAYSGTVLADRRVIRRRLDSAKTDVVPTQAGTPAEILKTQTFSRIPSINTLLKNLSISAYLERNMVQAGLSMQVGSLVLMMGVVAMALTLVMQVTLRANLAIALTGGVVGGALLPLWWIRRKRKQRFDKFGTRFPSALAMIQSSLQAGHSLNYALEVSSEELPDPIAGEFRQVLEEMRLGLSPREALENLYKRIPIAELRFFMLAVVLTREVGGNLSEVLGSLASTLRERTKLRQQCRALSAQGRASAVMLFLLPPGVGFLANLVSPGFIEPLFTTNAGRICLGIAFGFQMAGFLLIRKIVNPKEFQFG
jgi:tight adherence protein B